MSEYGLLPGLSISYTFVTLIEGRWRNLLSLLVFWHLRLASKRNKMVTPIEFITQMEGDE